jgi:hypothetical protein
MLAVEAVRASPTNRHEGLAPGKTSTLIPVMRSVARGFRRCPASYPGWKGPEHGARLTHVRDCADTCPMPLPVRTALLAVAALAALALAAVRITHAAEQKPIAVEQARPERSATPAQAAATLAKLHAPPGFRQVKSCRFPFGTGAEKCFWTPRALVLNAKTLERISASWPARAGVDPLLDFCSAPHHHPAGIVMGHCNWELELGPELVAVSSDSVLVPTRSARTPTAAKVLRYWRRGTEITLGVIGHWPHDRAPASALRL